MMRPRLLRASTTAATNQIRFAMNPLLVQDPVFRRRLRLTSSRTPSAMGEHEVVFSFRAFQSPLAES
jgi:hypothetical protein